MQLAASASREKTGFGGLKTTSWLDSGSPAISEWIARCLFKALHFCFGFVLEGASFAPSVSRLICSSEHTRGKHRGSVIFLRDETHTHTHTTTRCRLKFESSFSSFDWSLLQRWASLLVELGHLVSTRFQSYLVRRRLTSICDGLESWARPTFPPFPYLGCEMIRQIATARFRAKR